MNIFLKFENFIKPFKREYDIEAIKGIKDFYLLHARGIKKYLIFAALFAGLSAAIEVYLFNFLGRMVDSLSIQGTSSFWSVNANALLMISAVLIIALPIVTATHSLLNHQTLIGNFPTKVLFNTHLFLVKQSMQFYQNEAAGKVSAKIIQLSTAARVALLRLLDVFVYAAVFFGSITIMLARVDSVLLTPIVLWLIGYIYAISVFVPRLKHLSSNQAEARSDMIGKLVDTYSNIVTVKLFSCSAVEEQYAASYMGSYLGSVHSQMRFISKMVILIWILNSFLIFSAGALAFWLWSNEAITSGAVAATIAVVLRVYTISHWIMWESSALFENVGIINDGLKLFPSRQGSETSKQKQSLLLHNGSIAFDNVRFGFTPGNDVLRNLTLKIASGEKIGIVGRSGSGKSTIIKLLLQFFEPDYGSIFIGKQNIADFSQEDLLKHFSVVAQDVELLNRSIRDNLTYGKVTLADTEIIAASKLAKAHDFIKELTDSQGRRGYDAHVGERGVKLSGGQRQRIALARALLKDAPIFIFDEATSALDSEVESQIMDNLRLAMKDKTTIVIAHRLATLAHLDRIVVIENGVVMEEGTHEALLASEGIYFQLWIKQSTKSTPHVLDSNQLLEVG